MQVRYQRRSPAVRVRHGKRLPQFGDTSAGVGDANVPNIPGPITVTVTEVQQPPTSSPPIPSSTPTLTVIFPSTISSTPLPSSLPPPSTPLGSPLTQVTAQSTASTISRLTPSASASASANNNGTKNDKAAQSNTSASRGVPVGSIVGITVAVVLVIIAAFVFLMRKRSVRNRLRLRGGWTGKGANGPSFLWIEPGEKHSTSPYPNTSGQNRGGETSPGATFAKAQTQTLSYPAPSFPYIPPPAPPRPPPAHGTQPSYDYNSGLFAPSALGLSVPAALTPGMKAPPAPASSAPSSFSTSAYTTAPPETATVRSTFIPTLPDELSITTGEVIRIMSEYDDGWALCSNARGEMGMAPIECLDRGVASQAQQEGREYRGLSRASSLAASPRPYGGMARV